MVGLFQLSKAPFISRKMMSPRELFCFMVCISSTNMVVAVSVFLPLIKPCWAGWRGDSLNVVSSSRYRTSLSRSLRRNEESVIGR